ncbi:DUF4143 domain-containing protein [Filimonas effusa]|uniref:DUF4143 domain-containing protein n=1 Tax=Filimonas effusa TaxID=2508721 RepID=UPI001C7090DD|nr:DUF4143 domain-containing protein [Filimonas effusa]
MNSFSLLSVRQNTGALWESYIQGERSKYNAYRQAYINSYFWRTCDQQEIDLTEETEGTTTAYEFKMAGEAG